MRTVIASLPVNLSMAMMLATATTMAEADEEWEFTLAPMFLWGMSIEGESTIEGKTAPLDLDFRDDVLENLEAVFTLHFEARRDDWGFFAEYQYAELKTDGGGTQGPITADVEIELDDTLVEVGAAWAFSDQPRTRWELLMGARYLEQETTVKADISSPIPLLNRQENVDGGDEWWHPFGGVRVSQALSDNWTLVARGDYGYGDSDNTAINLVAMFDYQFRDWGSAFVGYKHLDYDYESSSYGFDAEKRGPLVGLNLYW